MSTTSWDEKIIGKVIEYINKVMEKEVKFSIIETEEFKKLIWGDLEKREIYFCKRFCNTGDISDEAIINEIIFFYSCYLCYLEKDFRMERVRTVHQEICNRVKIAYLTEDETEEYKRLVRRRLFPLLDGGCYFRVGDKIRYRTGGGPYRYIITAIEKIDDEVFICYKFLEQDISNKEFMETEKVVYENFHVVSE